jgi:hypothetical protein
VQFRSCRVAAVFWRRIEAQHRLAEKFVNNPG